MPIPFYLISEAFNSTEGKNRFSDAFLFLQNFKQAHFTTITNIELRTKLAGYLEDLEYTEKDDELDANTLLMIIR